MSSRITTPGHGTSALSATCNTTLALPQFFLNLRSILTLPAMTSFEVCGLGAVGSVVADYKPGDVIQCGKGSPKHGLLPKTEGTVEAVDSRRNLIVVRTGQDDLVRRVAVFTYIHASPAVGNVEDASPTGVFQGAV
jgi:hypothetical protein